MEIKRQNGNFGKGEMFNMTQGSEVGKLSDKVGETLKLDGWVLYEDLNASGSPQEVLVVREESGELSATISATFIEQFIKLVDFMGDESYSVRIVGKKSKNNRDYITCSVVQQLIKGLAHSSSFLLEVL